MPILVDDLSVWDISFRWAGYDPRKLYFRYPLEVENNFRTLMKAILSADLGCWTISLEKRTFEQHEREYSIYYWLDDIYYCIGSTYFNKKLLKHALISRYDFLEWCERMNIPLPEFWFPQGWNLEYFQEEGELKPGHGFRLKYWTEEQRERYAQEFYYKERDIGGKRDDSKLRPSQEARIACCVVASNIWKEDPSRTIASVVRDDKIQKDCGAAYYVEDTVREWIKHLAPEKIRNSPGRPRKNTDTA